ncbi:hypothetical protein ACFZCY_19230 [Streptomyces sp. NPDC007983]|uniref:hypothetical protein n=1 Tax=Streptomyces sp. NPDC007983 TaxID=3364800 RepID=UPI0036EF801D
MLTRSRLVPLALATLLVGGGTAAATTASAATQGSQVIQSCYGNAENYTATGNGVDAAYWPGTGFKYTTGNCADINVKVNYSRKVRVCWKYIECDSWVQAYKGQWKVVNKEHADVPDGWGFYLEFSGGNNGTGQAAY